MTGTLPSDEHTLWEILGVSEDLTMRELDEAYKAISNPTPEQRYAYKALSSSWWAPCYVAYRTTKALYDAGFFDDELDVEVSRLPQWDPAFLTTDVSKVRELVKRAEVKANESGETTKETFVVLLSSGGYSPLHAGHVAMMSTARDVMESKGYNVVGGFFSPAHDSYVDTKAKGTAKCHIGARISAAEELLKNSDWLSVDPWAGYYLPKEVNFTDIIDRLETYLRLHVDQRIRVVYVFGSDNQGFAHAFTSRGNAVCVLREGYPITLETFPMRVAFSPVAISNVSSTSIRAGELYHDRLAMQQYLQEVVITHPRYLIRDEKDMAISQWFDGRDPNVVRAAAAKLLATLQGAIKDAFVDQIEMVVDVLDVELQRRLARQLAGNAKTISMDVFFEGDYNVNLSRAFEISGPQKKPSRMVHRPGLEELDLKSIPAGEYLLVEDDVATGTTMRRVKERLPHDVKITQELIMSKFDGIENDERSECYDIVDLRDFIVGSKHGGLVCYMPNGNIVRVPYLLPYVSLRSRAFIPADKEKDVALAVWKANVEFFEAIGNPTLEEAFPAFRDFAFYCTWNINSKMVDFCNWHVNLLSDQNR